MAEQVHNVTAEVAACTPLPAPPSADAARQTEPCSYLRRRLSTGLNWLGLILNTESGFSVCCDINNLFRFLFCFWVVVAKADSRHAAPSQRFAQSRCPAAGVAVGARLAVSMHVQENHCRA